MVSWGEEVPLGREEPPRCERTWGMGEEEKEEERSDERR